MNRFERILVVVPLNAADSAVLGWASLFARLAGATNVTCVHVHVPSELPGPMLAAHPELGTADAAILTEQLERSVANHVVVPTATRVRTLVRLGNPLGETLHEIEAGEIDLVIVDRTGDDCALAEKLARKAPCSVMAISSGTPVRCERVLAAVDFSPFSAKATDAAAALAFATGAELMLFHAYTIGWGQRGTPMVTREQLSGEMRAHHLQELAALARPLAARGLQVVSHVTDAPLPARAVCAFAQDSAMDLVTIGCRGHHAIFATLLGSTAETILRECPRPVLAVKLKGSGRSLLDLLRQEA